MTDIFHLITRPEWEAAKAAGVLSPSSLKDVGFIHLCFEHQLDETANRFFQGVPGLLAIRFESESFGDELRVEDTYGHGEFPHVYAAINTVQAVEVIELKLLKP